ncbi:putative acireductone synthase UTR4 NDAI_0G00320 [Naumovozyma dairenensis CBS 421]|uniref:Enolase-phosphatase E1 n=1 Tax=Naumovozyma dairenensis (strain ATCC 10597 / BCRC 20456 / CBS 421 / NBRC 0211 / NRRL Y-12639) TaxID=1071378 RepID=G0WDE7_NAUDC|nr:hypothetical protein NDAI_0G00320 [Naumovozyma dairenensis CBS 421]CCD25808.2 hypothetical protein NDAI_0G00320 [Naumovozyma dairenensis CBS 421]
MMNKRGNNDYYCYVRSIYQSCIMTYQVYLLDIEGTVCPIAFVKDVLFPYFASQVPLLTHSKDGKIIELLSQFGIENDDELTKHILDLVNRDVKDSILKNLQGHVWAKGYETGEIKAPIYSDAIQFIERYGDVSGCKETKIYIYSSGSVKAQKLLFAHVEGGDSKEVLDLQPYINGYFDINTSGKKTEIQSYVNILKDINMVEAPEKVLFLSDNPLELDAAKIAGISTGLALRPGNVPVPNMDKYSQYSEFSSL